MPVKIKHRYDDKMVTDAATYRVKYKDYFHLKNLYIMLHEWLIEEGYVTRKDENFPEEFYLQRETQQAGNEVWIWWRLSKVPTNNSYYRYLMDIDFHIILLKDVEMMHEGQKFKTNWGEVEVGMWANLELDYKKEWRNHWFLKHINRIFHDRIFSTSMDFHRVELHREAYRLQEAVKTYLQLKKFLPEPELQNYVPERGLGDPK